MPDDARPWLSAPPIEAPLIEARSRGSAVKLPAIKSGERKDRHGDGGIALALAYAASRKRAVAYGYTGARELVAEMARLMRDEPVERGRGLW